VVQVNPRTHESDLSVEVARCLPGPEAQADEQWSFVRHKKNQRWLWYAIDSAIGRVLAFVFGRRTDEVCRSLLEKLAVFNVARYFTDGWGSYSKLIPPDKHVVGKRHTQRIENKNLLFRTRIKRLARKTLCFSKSETIMIPSSDSSSTDIVLTKLTHHQID
jgi:insertion element IS1 protein InsB